MLYSDFQARMGASVSSRSQGCLDKTLSALDLIIADKDAPPNIIKDAKKKNIPVVSAFWIMQSIINGKRLAFENIKKWNNFFFILFTLHLCTFWHHIFLPSTIFFALESNLVGNIKVQSRISKWPNLNSNLFRIL